MLANTVEDHNTTMVGIDTSEEATSNTTITDKCSHHNQLLQQVDHLLQKLKHQEAAMAAVPSTC